MRYHSQLHTWLNLNLIVMQNIIYTLGQSIDSSCTPIVEELILTVGREHMCLVLMNWHENWHMENELWTEIWTEDMKLRYGNCVMKLR